MVWLIGVIHGHGIQETDSNNNLRESEFKELVDNMPNLPVCLHHDEPIGKVLRVYHGKDGKLRASMFIDETSQLGKETYEHVLNGELNALSLGGLTTLSVTEPPAGCFTRLPQVTKLEFHEVSIVERPGRKGCYIEAMIDKKNRVHIFDQPGEEDCYIEAMIDEKNRVHIFNQPGKEDCYN
jgi:Caudovirus prohead serine protease